MFERLIDRELDRIRTCPQAKMLGGSVFGRLEECLRRRVELIAGSTTTHMIARVVASQNPVAAACPELLCQAERTQALETLRRRIDSGQWSLPEPLVECLELELGNVTDAFVEALARLAERRDAICDALLDGRRLSVIEDVGLSAGDTHRCGRSVTVFHTDAGSVVYKPHDLRVDECLHEFAGRFFQDFVGIPRAIAFDGEFGLCEYVEKRRAQGVAEAERFWYRMGGLAAFAKLLGSTDLHYQNILCHGPMPYMIDLETALSPVSCERVAYLGSAETHEFHARSLAPSLLMPARVEDLEMSALMNTDETGIAPVVDGEVVTVLGYLPSFREGYHAAYARAVERREEIREAVASFPADMQVRFVPRPTRVYWLMLKRLHHHGALASRDARRGAEDALAELLRKGTATVTSGPAVVASELEQMRRGDVPYFTTTPYGLSLLADGRELARDAFGVSAIDRVLETLDAMGDEDEAFDLAFIDGTFGWRPQGGWRRARETNGPGDPGVRDGLGPVAPDKPLTARDAAAAALEVFRTTLDLAIRTPNGGRTWGFVDTYRQSFALGGPGLFDGLTGLAVFASACAGVFEDDQVREDADALVGEATEELRGLCRHIDAHEGSPGAIVGMGEGAGLAGVLTGIALISRHAPDEDLDAIRTHLLAFLDREDFSRHTYPDRITGLAGLVSALCRFEEYRGHTKAIRAAADRLLELRTLPYQGHVLWKTMHEVPRALSGAGHGMAGIAEALLSASRVLGDARYEPAAAEALDYELEAHRRYAHRFGTWADLRDFPPTGYMHGYCAGAPGIGIMARRIMDAGAEDEVVRTLQDLARTSVDALPLNHLDHLCCGNAAIAECYLTLGDRDAAGRVLAAVLRRVEGAGGWRSSPTGAGGSRLTASLFNGMCGVGYEMLRYARPERIPSVL